MDTASLESLAEAGVRFTLLAPHQASEVRAPGGDWTPVGQDGIDTGVPYEVALPSGRRLAVLFYDGPVSRAVAFERLLDDGATFARRILETLKSRSAEGPRLFHIATDGETYGHHHRFGEMALAYALERIEDDPDAELINYASFLDRHPPTREVRIRERTSWSCAHGIGRWTDDCGCRSGVHPAWHQRWRRPLRETLDWLRAELDPAFERAASTLLRNPWEARDAYVDVVLDRSSESVTRFLDRHARTPAEGSARRTALELLELQRHAMLMYTSCGWFFDDVSGIESVQVLRYADRALQLARRTLGLDLEPEFLDRLGEAQSNTAETPDGGAVFARLVVPSRADREKVGAHAALQPLFDRDRAHPWRHAWDVEADDRLRVQRAGPARLVTGSIRVRSRITEEEERLGVAALHFGDHNLVVAARPEGDADPERLSAIESAFGRADLTETLRRIEEAFPGRSFTLADLFPDEQRDLLGRLLAATLDDADDVLHRLHRRNAPLVRYLANVGVPVPESLRTIAEMALNADLKRVFRARPSDADRIRGALEEFRSFHVTPAPESAGPEAQRWMDRLVWDFDRAPWNPETIERLHAGVRLLAELPLEVDLEDAVKRIHRLRRRVVSGEWVPFAGHPEEAAAWRTRIVGLGDALGFRLTQEDWTPPAPSR